MARQPIIQRIALDGGDAIKAQLKALGDAGEKAFNQIQSAALKADLAKFGTSLKTLGSDLATVASRVALVGAGLTTAAVGAGAAVLGLAKSGAEAADAAGKAAQTTGLQIDAYGRLEFAAKMANVGSDEFVAGMSKLNKAIAEAAKGTTDAASAFNASGVEVIRFGGKVKDATKPLEGAGAIFAKLGVRIKDANGKLRSNEAIVQDVAQAFARLPDGALKSALAIELFGKAGANLLPFLNQGKDGLRELGAEAEKLGIIFSPEQFQLGDALGDQLDKVGTAIRAIKVQLGLLFAPIVLEGAKGLTDIIVANKDAILALGAALARGVASGLGDLLHLLSGNAQNVKNPWIRDWATAIVQFGSDLKNVFTTVVVPAFSAIRDGAKLVADGLNSIFGTNITGGELALGAALLGLVGVFGALASAVGVVVAGIGLLAGLVGGIPLAIAAAALATGIAIAVFWDDIVAGATAAWQNIQAGAATAWQFVQDGAASAWAAIVQGATDLWAQVVAAFQDGQQMAVDAFNSIVATITDAWTGLVDRLGSIATDIVNRIVNAFNGLKDRIGAIWNGIVDVARSAFSRVGSFVDDMISRISAAISRLKELIGLGGDSSSSSSGGGSSQGFAGGGAVRGPGGPRTDSILARLSDGEFVIQAAIVKKLGVDFFHHLNNGFLPSLRGLRGFSAGGLAASLNGSMSQLALPRFAAGGLAKLAPASQGGSGATMHVKLDFGLGPDSVFDLITSDFVASKLQSFALRSAHTSAGRRPIRS